MRILLGLLFISISAEDRDCYPCQGNFVPAGKVRLLLMLSSKFIEGRYYFLIATIAVDSVAIAIAIAIGF